MSEWTIPHTWAAAALSAVSYGYLRPTEDGFGPRVCLVLPGTDATLGEAAMQELYAARGALADPSMSWIQGAPRLMPASDQTDGSDSEPFSLLVFDAQPYELWAQLMGTVLPESALGVVVVSTHYLQRVQVDGSLGATAPTLVLGAGPDWPLEDANAEPVVIAWAESVDGQSAMLAAKTGDSDPWDLQPPFADLARNAEAEGEHLGYPHSLTNCPPAVLQMGLGTYNASSDVWMEMYALPVAGFLGRMALAMATAAAVGHELSDGFDPWDVLESMTDPDWGQDLVDGGWEAVRVDQLGPRNLGLVYQPDEATFLSADLLQALAEQRAATQRDARRQLRDVILVLDGPQADRAAEAMRMAQAVFAAHPHWRADGPLTES